MESDAQGLGFRVLVGSAPDHVSAAWPIGGIVRGVVPRLRCHKLLQQAKGPSDLGSELRSSLPTTKTHQARLI